MADESKETVKSDTPKKYTDTAKDAKKGGYEAKNATTPTKQTGEKKYPLEKLGKNCRDIFGVSPSAFAGATKGMSGDYTVAQIQAKIEKWSKREVK